MTFHTDYNEQISNRLIYDEERKYGKIPTRIYTLYLKSCGLYVALVFCVTAFGWQAFRIYTDVWLRRWTDNIHNTNNINDDQNIVDTMMDNNNNDENKSSLTIPPNDNVSLIFNCSQNKDKYFYAFLFPIHIEQLLYYFNVYGAMSTICILLAMVSTPIGQWAGFRACQRLHDRLLAALMDKSLNFFQITPLGRVMNRFSNDINVIDKVRRI